MGGDSIREPAPKHGAKANALGDHLVAGAAARLVRVITSQAADHNQFVIGACRLSIA